MSVHFEDVEYKLDLSPPSDELLEYARTACGETEETRAHRINELRELIYERGDVEPGRTNDDYLLKFLRARNFHIEASYKLFVNYLRYRDENPEFHENVEPAKLTFIGDDDVMQVLPYREQTGRRVIIIKIGNWNTSDYPTTELFKAALSIMELGALEPRSQILGGICVFDLEGLSLSHARQVTPSVAYKLVELLASCFPLKIHAIHVIFESWIFDIIYNFFKPFLEERTKSKIFFHRNDVESLQYHINPKYLPEKYGGIRPNYKYNKWFEYCRKTPELIKELRTLGYIVREEDLEKVFYESDDEE